MYFHIVSSLEKAIGMPLNETSTGKSKEVNLCQSSSFCRTCCVQKLLERQTISVHNMLSPGLSLEFSCIELVIQ